VDDNPDFSSPAISATVTPSIYTPIATLADGTYYWHVRSNNGVWSGYSSAWVVNINTVSACYTLNTASIAPAGGSVDVNPAPNCAGGKYANGTTVTLTPTANAGYTFAGWKGDASGSSDPLTVTIDADKSVSADFAPEGTIVVNSVADTQANDGACTLREAIVNANTDDQSGSTDCAAGSGTDTVLFSVSGTITLGTAAAI
jgi:CSLREA domain-containing protein/uncharacterized repeat protein (TIGR02543 family)